MFFWKRSISVISAVLLVPIGVLGEEKTASKASAITPSALNLPVPMPWRHKPESHLPAAFSRGTSSEVETIAPAAWCQGIYNWLCAQQNPLTGLVESFEGSADPMLKDQAATYDQAVAGMAFLLLGDAARAKKILAFYAARWEGAGFCNFYSAANGRVGLEWRRHAGPNLWIAMLAYQYARRTGDETFLPLAEGLCDWVASLPRFNGGPAMSDQNELEIPWREIVSTENVIDALAAFQMAAVFARDARQKQRIERDIAEMKRFLKGTALLSDGALARGYRPFIDGVDRVAALDTTSWFIAAALPENILYEYGQAPQRLLAAAERLYWIDDGAVLGYDYTDEEEAKKAGRPRMVSVEWSAEMAVAYWLAAASPASLPAQKIEYAKKWGEIRAALDRYRQNHGDRVCYPYAGLAGELTFAQGWRTPKARPDGRLPGSVAGVCWRLFAEGWNPLRLDQPAPRPLPKVKIRPPGVPSKKEIEEAKLLPSALTSEGLTTAAWLNLNAGRADKARELALRCIHRYGRLAREQQAKKAADGGLIAYDVLNEEVKQRIFGYAALNDVAACWVILSKIDPQIAPKAAQQISQHYSLAQIWDPAGKFWTPASLPR